MTEKIDKYNERISDYICTVTLSCTDSDFDSYLNFLEFIKDEIDVAIEVEYQITKDQS